MVDAYPLVVVDVTGPREVPWGFGLWCDEYVAITHGRTVDGNDVEYWRDDVWALRKVSAPFPKIRHAYREKLVGRDIMSTTSERKQDPERQQLQREHRMARRQRKICRLEASRGGRETLPFSLWLRLLILLGSLVLSAISSRRETTFMPTGSVGSQLSALYLSRWALNQTGAAVIDELKPARSR